MPLKPGQVLQNRYRIVSLLGQGGMGAVYRAWHVDLKMPIAIKEMVPQPGLDDATLNILREQFKQEAAVLMRLKHQSLVSVYDYFVEDGNTYLVMEFVEGENLGERIDREGALPEAVVRSCAIQLLSVLRYCHSLGVLHRDIKPQNIILRPESETPRAVDVVLVDFGLVKLWNPRAPQTRTVIRGAGSLEYSPPEQYGGASGHTGPYSDIYSLGATLYHALTGFAPPSATERLLRPESLPSLLDVRWDASPRLAAAIMRALELQPERRFITAAQMEAAIASDRVSPTPEHRPAPVLVSPTVQASGLGPAPTVDPSVSQAPGSPAVQAPSDAGQSQWAPAPTPSQSGIPSPFTDQPVRKKRTWLLWGCGVSVVLFFIFLALGLGKLMQAMSVSATATAQAGATATVRARATAGAFAQATQVAEATHTAATRAAATAQVQATAAAVATATSAVQGTATAEAVYDAVGRAEAGRVRVAGPLSGDFLIEGDGFIETKGAGVDVRSFSTEVTFRNPSGKAVWDYGLGFRHTEANYQYRLILSSLASWKLWLREGESSGTEIASGQLPALNTGPGETNHIQLVVDGGTGWFFLNRVYVATLDVSEKQESGEVFAGSGFYTNSAHNVTVSYEDFSVWELR